MKLPAPVRDYFAANARLDAAAMAKTFAPDAVVQDENASLEGARAIRTWIDKSSIALSAIATPQSLVSEHEAHRVTALVTGKFPGSPVTLSFEFTLNGNLIQELQIT